MRVQLPDDPLNIADNFQNPCFVQTQRAFVFVQCLCVLLEDCLKSLQLIADRYDQRDHAAHHREHLKNRAETDRPVHGHG